MSMSKTQRKDMMKSNVRTIGSLLEQMKVDMASALPKHISPDRMARIAMTALKTTPKLQECDPRSFIASIMIASQLGLEPGIMGLGYLIPFWNNKRGCYECTFMPGYRGFLDLARRSGQIVSLVARAVYENDEFSYEFGLHEKLEHKPSMENKGEIIAVYSVANLKDGGHQFDVMSKEEIDRIRSISKSKDDGPWVTYYDEMAKKTVLRRLFKWLPCSIEMQKAVSIDEQQEAGTQNIKAIASEEFDMDFVIDADPEQYEAQQETTAPAAQVKSDRLMNKIKSAKNAESVNTDIASEEQLKEIHALLSVKVFSNQRMNDALAGFGVTTLAELSQEQAIAFINQLKKEEDK